VKRKYDFWYLITGLLIGLGIGLLAAWVVAPVRFSDTTPSSLRIDRKDEYRYLIASSFAANGDLVRARARLEVLQDSDPIKALGEQAQRMISTGSALPEVQVLADLSTAIQNQLAENPSPSVEIPLTASATNLVSSTPAENPTASPSPSATETPFSSPSPSASPSPSPSPTQTSEVTATLQPKPISTMAPRATNTITPTITAPFKITKVSPFCEPSQPGLLQVYLTNSDGKPAPGIEVVVTWSDGEEHFFTGLKPEMGNGYADFVMAENVDYSLTLSGGGVQVPNLQAGKCGLLQSNAYPGGIRLDFKQP